MRYRLFTLAAVLVFAGCIYAFCVSLTSLLDTGTCASGGPYVIARPCPEGTDADGLLLAAAIIGLFAAMGLVALRGRRPGGGGFGFSSMVLAGWALFFTITGAVSLIHSLTSDVIRPDGKTGGIIVGATFLFMGLPVLLFGVAIAIKNARDTARGTHGGQTVYPDSTGVAGWASAMKKGSQLMRHMSRDVASGNLGHSAGRGYADDHPGHGGSGDGDTITQLERLQRLRESGTLSEAEFASEKQRILSARRS